MLIKVVVALIRHNKKILMAKRAGGELKGKWEFPGGKIRKGEDPKEAIVREIKEELNLEIVPLREINTFYHEYPFAKLQLTLIECEIKDKKPQILLDGSHTKISWVDVEDNQLGLTPLDEKIFAYLKKHLHEFRSKLSNSPSRSPSG